MNRRAFLAGAVAALALPAMSVSVRAEPPPARPLPDFAARVRTARARCLLGSGGQWELLRAVSDMRAFYGAGRRAEFEAVLRVAFRDGRRAARAHRAITHQTGRAAA